MIKLSQTERERGALQLGDGKGEGVGSRWEREWGRERWRGKLGVKEQSSKGRRKLKREWEEKKRGRGERESNRCRDFGKVNEVLKREQGKSVQQPGIRIGPWGQQGGVVRHEWNVCWGSCVCFKALLWDCVRAILQFFNGQSEHEKKPKHVSADYIKLTNDLKAL